MASLAENLKDLVVPKAVHRRKSQGLSSLEFLREYVATNQPVVITDLDRETWPCLQRWTDEYLLDQVGGDKVSVNVTPRGLGDFVDRESGMFVQPLEATMSFGDFWQALGEAEGAPTRPDPGDVHYLSKQNDSLREELPVLAADVPPAVPLGVEAFGNDPEAVNLWIGDFRSTSSCHKDHYENLYVVVRGEKVFTLLPPAAIPFLYERKCPPARFARPTAVDVAAAYHGPPLEPVPEAVDEDGRQPAHVAWIPVDVGAAEAASLFPDFDPALAVEVRVRAGEMLYLPAMWYHQVSQVGLTIAVNYWHDMHFGAAYAYNQFVRGIAGLDDEFEEPPPAAAAGSCAAANVGGK